MDVAPKVLYMREHSNVIRKWTSATKNTMQENPVFQIDRISRIMVVSICRIKQRLLKQAWERLIERTGVYHDYTKDLRTILFRQLPTNELRTELEIEVLYKWVMQVKDIDPTGIASTIYECKKKSAIYAALQQLRLEFYGPGEAILFQGDAPRIEDGHFTIIRGSCDVLQFTGDSVRLTKLLHYARKRKFDETKKLLQSAQVVAHIPELSGFGELSTLTGVHRAATIQTEKGQAVTEVLILPKHPLLDLLKYRYSSNGSTQSEAIDFLRQSGLANRISPKDLVLAASTMSKKTLEEGEVLFYKGDEVKCIYMIVSGEFLLDTADYIIEGVSMPFVNAHPDKCYHLSSGSMLGDEGVLGDNKVFESTAAVVSSVAVVFQVEGFAMNFIAEKMGCLRYSALYYRDRLCWESENQVAEQINPFTFFGSLRKSIAYTKPFRGTTRQFTDIVEPDAPLIVAIKQKKIAKRNAENPHHKMHQQPSSKNVGSSSLFAGMMMNQQQHHHDSRPVTGNSLRGSGFLDGSRSSTWGDGSSAFPKLKGVGLHRALEVNKIVKKHLQNSIKLHAKENILYEELRKKTIEEGEGDDSTAKAGNREVFSKSLKDFYDRSTEVTKKLSEVEETQRKKSTAKAAVRFFSLAHDDESTIGSHPSWHLDGAENRSKSPDDMNKDDPQLVAADGSLQNSVVTNKPPKESHRHNIHLTPTSSAGNSPRSESNTLASSTVVDLNPLAPTKVEGYFEWIDGLKKQQYRALTFQSQQTVDINQHYHIDAKLGLGLQAEDEVDWKEIGEILNDFSLTPSLDMGLPWFLHSTGAKESPEPSLAGGGILKPPKGGASNAPLSPPRVGTAGTVGEEGKKKKGISFNEVPQVREISSTSPATKAQPPQPQKANNNNSPPRSPNPGAMSTDQSILRSTSSDNHPILSHLSGLNGGARAISSRESASEDSSLSSGKKSLVKRNRRGGILNASFQTSMSGSHGAKLGKVDQVSQDLKTKAKIENDYKGGYQASGWREEYVQQKVAELKTVSIESFYLLLLLLFFNFKNSIWIRFIEQNHLITVVLFLYILKFTIMKRTWNLRKPAMRNNHRKRKWEVTREFMELLRLLPLKRKNRFGEIDFSFHFSFLLFNSFPAFN
jgi:hypothetical protein